MSATPDETGLLGSEIDGRYRLDRFIGAGTMGSVFAGTQLAVGRPVAIKLLNAAMQTNQEVRDRFRVEAQAIATLSHPNCVTLYDFGWSSELGALFMAVEYLDGKSLDLLIGDGMPVPMALALARQIADVLTFAHGAGIMHRDLKPENVMVVGGADGSAQAKVLDFGLARIFEDASGSTRLTRQGQLFGTPAYMSPEQCRGVLDVGPPADIYALGISLFEMLLGRLPFDSRSVPELLILHSTEPPPPVPATDGIPLSVSAMIAQMLSKVPDDRPTATDVVAVLTAVLEGHSAPSLSGLQESRRRIATAENAQTTVDVAAPIAPAKRGSMVPILVGIALVMFVAIIGVGALAGDDSPDGESPSKVLSPVVAVEAEPAKVVDEPAPDRADKLAGATDLALEGAASVAYDLSEIAATIAQETDKARQRQHAAAKTKTKTKRAKTKTKRAKTKTSQPKTFKKLGFSYE